MGYLILIIVAALSCSICTEVRHVLSQEYEATMFEPRGSDSPTVEKHHDYGQ